MLVYERRPLGQPVRDREAAIADALRQRLSDRPTGRGRGRQEQPADEIAERFCRNSERRYLEKPLRLLVQIAIDSEAIALYLNGSFVTDKRETLMGSLSFPMPLIRLVSLRRDSVNSIAITDWTSSAWLLMT